MNLKDIKQTLLSNPEVQKEYEALQPEYAVVRAVLEDRKQARLTQQELADMTGIHRSDISKLENGTSNPTIGLLQRLAEGMGMTVRVEFVPKS